MGYEANLLAHYAAVHRRLWPPAPKPQPKIAAPPITPEPPPILPEPLPRQILRLSDKHAPVMLRVICAAGLFYGIDDLQLSGPSRRSPLIRPRHVAMYLCFELCRSSSVQIGRWFHRDHSTAIHARKKITADLVSDPELADEIACIRHMIDDGVER